ncbi:MAG: CPBP family intramembrane metalloprotease [Microbacteriaceae bacterium]|nr:CPBP family intramembrane metalloprotease [Microbacteriaceae bacterium]
MSRTALDARLSPAWRAVLLGSATSAATVIAAVVLSSAAPQLDTLTARLIVVIALAVAAVIVVATSRHRDLLWSGGVSVPLLIVPTLIVLAPFAGGLKDLGAQTTLILVVGYIATGVFEEFWFRGVILRTLRTWTPLRAALFSSAIFGLAHLSNLVFGANLWVTIAQVVGAACYGVGFAALRLRGTSIWALVVLHAITDIALQLGDVSSAWRWGIMIGGDTALLIFGLIILRKAPKSAPQEVLPVPLATGSARQ